MDGVDPISRPDLQGVLSETDRLLGASSSGRSNDANTINNHYLPTFLHSPNLYFQSESYPNIVEDGVESYSSQADTVAAGSWPVDDHLRTYQTWKQPFPDFSSRVFSELDTTQTPTINFPWTEVVNVGGLPLSLPIGYNYGRGHEELQAGGLLNHSDNGDLFSNWSPGERSSVATGLDSEFVYNRTGSRASYAGTDISTPVTSPGEGIQRKRHRCDPCDQSFSLPKDLKRHEGSESHQKSSRLPKDLRRRYSCRCGFCQPRKDLYIRHLNKCQLKRIHHNEYECSCQCLHQDKDEHMAHISECGKLKPGRPRNSARR